MDRIEKKIDFDSINKRITEEDLDISIIRIIYKGLTKREIGELSTKQATVDLKEDELLAKYPSDLNPLYKGKAVAVLYLGA